MVESAQDKQLVDHLQMRVETAASFFVGTCSHLAGPAQSQAQRFVQAQQAQQAQQQTAAERNSFVQAQTLAAQAQQLQQQPSAGRPSSSAMHWRCLPRRG